MKSKKKFDKTVALVGGAFKPPHSGHLDMVQKYSKMADEVIVIISNPKSEAAQRKTSEGVTITPEMSKKIWELYFKKYGLKNAKVVISSKPSPTVAVFQYADDADANGEDINVIFGVSSKGKDLERFKPAMKYFKDRKHVFLIDPAKTAVEPYDAGNGKAVSATDIRSNVKSFKMLKKLLPSKLSDKDIKDIQKILSGKQTLSVSGNAVSGVSRINKANVQATFDDFAEKVFKLIGAKKKDAELVGSSGKKETSGDIDVGIGNVKDIRAFLQNAYSVLKKHGIECTPTFGLNEVSVKWPISNEDGKQAGKFVQIDIMPAENINMLRFSNSIPDLSKTKYKGGVRSIFLQQLASFTDRKTLRTQRIDGKNVAVEYERYMLIPAEGLFRAKYSHIGKAPGKIVKTPTKTDKHLVTNDPQKIVKILFGNGTTLDDVSTTEGCIEQFKKTTAYKDKKVRSLIVDAVKGALKKSHFEDVPKMFKESEKRSTDKKINEAELSRRMLLKLHSIDEKEIADFIQRSYYGSNNHNKIFVWSIAFSPADGSLFIRFNFDDDNRSFFVNADFDDKTMKFIALNHKVYSAKEAKAEFRHAAEEMGLSYQASSMNVWIVWGSRV